MLLLLSTDGGQEPRLQITDTDRTQQVFGANVEGLRPDQETVFDSTVPGYPVASLSSVPPGEYWVQGLLHVYETFTRSDGHVVKLPPDRGEGQQWASAPGNLYSSPARIRIDPSTDTVIRVSLDKKIPPLPDVADSTYVKHIKIQSERLTKFWGRPMYLGAILVLPEGWDSHPVARFPLAIFHGHFQREVFPWREAPPDPGLPPADLSAIARYCPNGHEGELCTKYGYERVLQQYGYELYKQWTGPGFPRVIMVNIQHANPYYDDSYAVNSENLGPYGDAITYELIPYIEKTFRGLGPWARGLYGGSTGGWEALGDQMFYPDEYNGAYANCPDPIDFRRFTNINIYEERNAYFIEGPWRRTPRPGYRDYLGQTLSTIEQMNTRELVLGTKSRSGGQWDIWEAVYSPVGADGYPQRIWDKASGAIDATVAGVLARALRPRAHPDARLGDARAEAARQDHAECRPVRQFLPERRGVSRRGVPEVGPQPARRRDGRLRHAGRALLERRPRPHQRDLAAHLQQPVHPRAGRALAAHGAERRRYHGLEILTCVS